MLELSYTISKLRYVELNVQVELWKALVMLCQG